MTFEDADTAAQALRGRDDYAYEPLGLRYLDDMAVAAAAYRRAKSELVTLRSAQASEGALMAATERLAHARLAVKRAIRV